MGYATSAPYLLARPTLVGWYTFQETPASWSTSCIVGQVQFHSTSGVAFVSVIGPPIVIAPLAPS